MNNFEINTQTPSLLRAEKDNAVLKETATHVLAKAQKKQLVKCNKCGKRTQVYKFEYADTYWYVQPHGCIGGDYYNWTGISLKCPKCGEVDRISIPFKYEGDEARNEFNKIYDLIHQGTKCKDIRERL